MAHETDNAPADAREADARIDLDSQSDAQGEKPLEHEFSDDRDAREDVRGAPGEARSSLEQSLEEDAGARLDAEPDAEAASEDREAPIPDSEDGNIHITLHEDGWHANIAGSDFSVGVQPTKKDAISLAREAAREFEVSVIVHGTDGRIQRAFEPRA